MNKLLWLALSSGLVAPMHAQLFSPESLAGAALGGIAGAVVGHNSGGHGGEGAAIGAGVGLLLGSLVHHDRRERGYYQEPYYYHRPNYALGGALVGGVTGAVVGHNSGHHGAEGAAIGAGAGLLFGSIAESETRRRERAYAALPQYTPVTQVSESIPAATPPAPKQRVIVRETKVSAMSSANRLFGR